MSFSEMAPSPPIERPVHDVFDELHQHFLPDARQELAANDVAG
jgi:hypothetical protein